MSRPWLRQVGLIPREKLRENMQIAIIDGTAVPWRILGLWTVDNMTFIAKGHVRLSPLNGGKPVKLPLDSIYSNHQIVVSAKLANQWVSEGRAVHASRELVLARVSRLTPPIQEGETRRVRIKRIRVKDLRTHTVFAVMHANGGRVWILGVWKVTVPPPSSAPTARLCARPLNSRIEEWLAVGSLTTNGKMLITPECARAMLEAGIASRARSATAVEGRRARTALPGGRQR